MPEGTAREEQRFPPRAPEREAAIEAFVKEAGWGAAERRPLAADASFRRYDRLTAPDGERAVLMDAPPGREDIRPFERVQDILVGLGLGAPRRLARDEAEGLLLLEDLGDRTFTRALAEGAAEGPLYELAIDLLIELHRRFDPASAGAGFPRYDEARFLDEALLFTDWYLPAVKEGGLEAGLRQDYVELWRGLLPLAAALPTSLVLRDYHVDNLMLLEGREGIAACGLLDFQDAVLGPVAYDLVSLLEDARRDVPDGVVEAGHERYLAAFPELDREAFAAASAVLAAQRNAKIIGIFTRLCRRDGKSGYLKHIPRVWRLLEADLAHPALAPLRAWFDRALPAAQRRLPDSGAAS